MPEFRTTLRVNAPPTAVFDAVADFPAYKDVVKSILESEVEETGNDGAVVRFALDLAVRRVVYRLRYETDRPRSIRWSLVDSNTVTENEGAWGFENEGEATRVTYRHHVAFPAWMAWAVTDAAFAKEMQKTLDRFKEHIESQ